MTWNHGLFEPLQLAPKYLLVNAEHDGEKYTASLAATSLKDLRRLPASLFTGNAGGIVHPVIEPYVLPLSPYEAFSSGVQNDVPLLIGSNADEARAIVDVTHDTAATFDSDLEHSVGQLSPALLAAYPHATDEEARQAQLLLHWRSAPSFLCLELRLAVRCRARSGFGYISATARAHTDSVSFRLRFR
jgi:para-nitrobenzyl esterase